MASGRKNYFRHSFFARNDMKLRLLRDRLGVGFYFYFFTLLEQCGEASAEELQEKYVFHDSTIRSLWGVNLKKSERIASEMNAVGLLFFEKREKTFVFTIPNFSKYLGKYSSKFPPNAPNKRKVKENIKKIKDIYTPEKNSGDVAKVIDYLNKKTGKKFRHTTPATHRVIKARLNEKFTFQDMVCVVDKKCAEWLNDDKMAKYLRPETLFGSKFEGYLNESEKVKVEYEITEEDLDW